MFKRNFKPYHRISSGSTLMCSVQENVNESIVTNVFDRPSSQVVKKSVKSMEMVLSETPPLDSDAFTLEAQLASGKTLKEVNSQIFSSSAPSDNDVALAEKLISSDEIDEKQPEE